MAVAFINLGASANPDINSATDATSYANTSWTPPTSDLIVAYVYSREAAGNNAVNTFTGNGLTWVQIATFQFGGSNIHRLSLYGANASGSSTGVTTVDYGANLQLGCIVSFFQVTGVDLSGGVAAAFVQAPTGTGTATSGTVTLAAAGNPDNRPIACFFHAANEVTTPGANFTELDDLAGTAPLRALDTQYRVDAYDTATAASWTTSSLWGGIAAEIKATSLAFVDSSHPLLMQTSMRRLSGPPLTPQLPPGPTVVTSTTFNQELTATATTTATVVKSVGKALSATATSTATVVKSVGKSLAATATSTASIVKSVGKVLSATATSTATMVRSVAKTLTATVTSTASIIAEFSAAAVKPLAPLMMTLRRRGTGPPLLKPQEPGPTVVTSTTFNQTLTATATTTASITKSVGKSLTATATTTASMVRQVGKQVTATATSTASIVKSVGKTLTATVASTATIVAVKSAAVLMSATVTTTATISRSVGKGLSATATSTAAMTRSVGKALTATATATASMVRQVGLTLAATVSSTASIVASFVVTIVPPLAPLMMTLRRQLGGGPPLLKPQEPGPVTATTFQQTLTATATTTATMVRSVGKVLSATATSTATVVRSVAKTLTATATATASLLAEIPTAAYETVKPLLMRLRVGPPRATEPPPTPPPPSFPPDRLSQLAVEALVLPTSQKARVSQLAVEALVLPTSQKARVSQVAVEALYRVLYESVEVTIID